MRRVEIKIVSTRWRRLGKRQRDVRVDESWYVVERLDKTCGVSVNKPRETSELS